MVIWGFLKFGVIWGFSFLGFSLTKTIHFGYPIYGKPLSNFQTPIAALAAPRSYGLLSKDWTPVPSDHRVELMRRHGLLPATHP